MSKTMNKSLLKTALKTMNKSLLKTALKTIRKRKKMNTTQRK